MQAPRFLCTFALAFWTCVWADPCTTVSTQGWTQEQKNMRQGACYSLIFQQTGQSVVVSISGDTICDGELTPPISQICTGQAMLDWYAQQEQQRAAAGAIDNARRQEIIDAAVAAGCNFSKVQIDARYDVAFCQGLTTNQCLAKLVDDGRRQAYCILALRELLGLNG